MRLNSSKKKKVPNRLTSEQSHILSDSSPFVVKEAYKALRTNIIFSLPGQESKCIGITSSARSEGKSTNSINLALAFAQIGKKTLLVDCDMRLPSIASKLRIAKQPGLSDFIVGEANVNESIQHYKENLDVMVAGGIPRDPTGLLTSQSMRMLLEKMREYFDYIIIDLPPITTVTDAAILSDSVDGYLLVVRHDSTDYRAVGEMLHQLRLSEGKILGFLYTNAPVSEKKYYNKYYA